MGWIVFKKGLDFFIFVFVECSVRWDKIYWNIKLFWVKWVICVFFIDLSIIELSLISLGYIIERKIGGKNLLFCKILFSFR